MKKSRRDFLKLASATLGGAVLSSCGTGGPPPEPEGTAQLPNGFRFAAIKNVGDLLPGGRRIASLRTDAVISDRDEVIYSALHEDGTVGLYGATVDFSARRPRVVAERSILQDGEAVPGGTVASFNAYDINGRGDVVLPVQVAMQETVSAAKVGESFLEVRLNGEDLKEGLAVAASDTQPRIGKGLYLGRAEGGLERLAFGDEGTTEGHEFYHLFGAAAVHGDDVLFAADFARGKAGGEYGEPAQGIFHLSLREALNAQGMGVPAQLVAENGPVGQLSTAGRHVEVNRYGLLDLHGGNFVLQGHTSRPEAMAVQAGSEGQIGGVLVAGKLSDPSDRSVISAAAETGLSLLSVENASAYGSTTFGPRMGPNNVVVNVIHTSDEAMTMFYGGRRVVAHGDLSPSGDVVDGVMPGCFGPQGEHYYTLTLRQSASELAAFDGREQRSLLKDGDVLMDESLAVSQVFMGIMLKQVNSSTHLAFQVSREDGSMALVVGSPL